MDASLTGPLAESEGRLDGTRGIVGMRIGGQPEHHECQDSLLVDAELVDAALTPVHLDLHQLHEPLRLIERCLASQPVDLDEHRGDRSQVGDPVLPIRIDPVTHGTWHETLQEGLRDRGLRHLHRIERGHR